MRKGRVTFHCIPFCVKRFFFFYYVNALFFSIKKKVVGDLKKRKKKKVPRLYLSSLPTFSSLSPARFRYPDSGGHFPASLPSWEASITAPYRYLKPTFFCLEIQITPICRDELHCIHRADRNRLAPGCSITVCRAN